MDTEKKYTQDEIDALGNKYNRMIGFGILAVAILIISINMCCRFAGAIKSRHYEYTDGIVIKKEEYKSYPFGANGRPNYNYEIKVEYVPEGESRTYTFWDYSHAYEFIDKGDTLRIYYMEDDPDESYAAQRDWLTRMYLPAENSYNIPLIIAAVLIIIGIYFFIDDNKTKAKKKMMGFIELNDAYHIQKYIPDSLAIGDDECSNAVIYANGEKGPGLYIVPFNDLEADSMIYIAGSLRDFLVDGVGLDVFNCVV